MLTEKTSENDYIYIVFLSTNTLMGKGIRLVTHNQYSHVTISFDGDLRRMYSFARYYINSPILGGFVTEQPLRYLHTDQDVLVKICRIAMGKEEYNRILQEIEFFLSNRESMIYNTPNALLSLFGRRLTVKNMFTCLEFVTYLLRYPEVYAIQELEKKLEQQVVYQGSLKEIASLEQACPEDDYFNKRDISGVVIDTVYHIKRVALRVLSA